MLHLNFPPPPPFYHVVNDKCRQREGGEAWKRVKKEREKERRKSIFLNKDPFEIVNLQVLTS